MNYPLWHLTTFGGGFFIALIAVVHVLVSHFAVGGGAFLVLLERKARTTEDADLLAYVKKHSRFFMLLTMVFGSITGVGIWWTIALLNPGGTSVLIHTFVFGWAAEWVFFLCEIVALFVYYYTFDRMDPKAHMTVGWIYFLSAWMSLFLINGIIDFMLTPGAWLETKGFWDGFFNPTFWPALVFRTGMALTLCGVFGFVTAAFTENPGLRTRLMRICSVWTLVPFVLMVAGLFWYVKVLPETVYTLIFSHSPEMAPYFTAFMWGLPALFALALIMALKLPQSVQKAVCVVVVLVSLVYLSAFEFVREGGRRPFIIRDYMYTSQVRKADVKTINEKGFLATARWSRNKQVTKENQIDAGAELFQFQCGICHAIDGPMHNIRPLIKKYDSVFGMDAKLNGLGKLNTYMPEFMGTRQERLALAAYLVKQINGIDITIPDNPKFSSKELPVKIPGFDHDTDEYVLLAWNDLGMHCISDSSAYWVLLPPANNIWAQLIRRGDMPELVTDGVQLRYQVEKGFEHPQNHVQFWKNAESIFGKKPDPGAGLSGNRTAGVMEAKEDHQAFAAEFIPVVPYPDDGSFNPYPVFTVTAVDKETGRTLAVTRTVAPTSTEMGCKNCHGGGWRVNGMAGFTNDTSLDVLKAHDKNSGTRLVERAQKGEPMLCQSCHADPVLNAKGKPGILNFPAAIHGWHANFLTDREGPAACVACHPARANGPTQCFRSHHADFMDCTNCHGTLEDHALSLLKKEKMAGKKGAARLMERLVPRSADTLDEINPRTPWLQEPDCLNCHKDYQSPETDNGFNTWTEGGDTLFRNRTDEMGAVMCEGCHSSTHATYPAVINRLGEKRDSIQPLQYQGSDRPIGNDCTVCHKVQPDFEGHHPNSLRR